MNLNDYCQGPSGLFSLKVYQRGELIEQIEEPNLVVDLYKQTQAHLIGGDVTGRSVSQFAVGTNGIAPVGGNTSITGAVVKNVDSVSYPAANQVSFAFSLATTEANGVAIMEFGLLTTSGVLFARKVRSVALNKANDISFAGSWTISY